MTPITMKQAREAARTAKAARTPSKRPVVVANVSDVHAGSTVAVCPERITLDDGGAFEASKAQRWLLQCWEDYWARVDAHRKAIDAELVVIFNGDLVEGDHHNTSQIISRNLNAQAAALTAVIATPLALKPDRIFIVRGTEAHVGNSASSEEKIADGLRRDKRPIVGDPETGAASWWHLRLDIHDTRLDVTHHGRTGQREHTRAGAAALHAHDILLAHVKDGDRYPDLCVRGHYHRFNDSYDACPVRVVTSGAWQLGTTGHVKKVAPDTLADVGGLIITVRPGERQPTVEKVRYRAARGPVVAA